MFRRTVNERANGAAPTVDQRHYADPTRAPAPFTVCPATVVAVASQDSVATVVGTSQCTCLHAFHAVRRSLFSDIFVLAKSRNISHPRKIVCGANMVSFISNCIQLRHVAGALDLDFVFGTVF